MLLDHHSVHLKESGLSDSTIFLSGAYSVTDPMEAGGLLGWSGPGPAPALAFPYCDLDGSAEIAVLRPDVPHKRSDGRAPKYEWPIETPPRPYFLPHGLVDPGIWRDPAQPLVLIEGIKKALAAVQQGVVAVSSQGTTVWHDLDHKQKTGRWRLHHRLRELNLAGRTIYVAFDGGDTSLNAHVIHAEARLAQMLLDVEASVRLLRIPFVGDRKAGLDDYLATCTDPKTALQRLLDTAVPADPLDRVREAIDSADRSRAMHGLLRDPSFQASLYIADATLVDIVRTELRRGGITKDSVLAATDAFRAMLRSASGGRSKSGADVPADVRDAAEALLHSPYLVQYFFQDVALDGLVGEEAAALTILLAVVSRKTAKPLHVVVKAASAAGKNHVVGRVVAYLPPADLVELTDLTPRSLTYMDSLAHRVVVIAEQEGAERAEYSMRVAMSEGALSVLVTEKGEDGRMASRKHEVPGPACFITTTTRAQIHDENETRVLEVNLDESPAQTQRIIYAQAAEASRPHGEHERIQRERRRSIWRTVLQTIEALEVVVPQAQAIAQRFPSNRVRNRRDFLKVLGLAKAHALLYQRQRKRAGESIVADDYDVQQAFWLSTTLWSEVSPRLAGAAQQLGQAFGRKEFTARRAAQVLGYAGPDPARRLLRSLEDAELIEPVEEARGSRAGSWRVKEAPTAPPWNATQSQAAGTP